MTFGADSDGPPARIEITRNTVIRCEGGRNRPDQKPSTGSQSSAASPSSGGWTAAGASALRLGEDRQWKAAAEALREVWENPGRRRVVLRLLRGLASLTSGRA